jgi:hypothetical protein
MTETPPTLDATLALRVDDVRDIIALDMEVFEAGELPPAIRIHYKGLDCLVFPEAATDGEGRDALTLEVSWWDWGARAVEPVAYTFKRQQPDFRAPLTEDEN